MHTNYHTHTFRCGHADNCADEQYVLAALQRGFDLLGFSDHAPWSSRAGDVGRTWYADYLNSVASLRQKYEGKIKIPLALECECYPQNFSWLRDQREFLDYAILGVHAYKNSSYNDLFYGHTTKPDDVKRYGECAIEGMQSGLFEILAHPDLVLMDYAEFDGVCEDVCREICRTAKECGVVLEYNLLGKIKKELDMSVGLGYPCEAFWKIAAEYQSTVIIGCDAHSPNQLLRADLSESAERELAALGLTPIEYLKGASA